MIKAKASDTHLQNIIASLAQIQEDKTVPKNVREKITNSIQMLSEDKNLKVKVNKSLQELDEISNDPNLPVYTRTQIWNIVSLLETM